MSEYNMIDGYDDPFYTVVPIKQRLPYIVYVKLDEQNRIIAVNSSDFLHDTVGWTEIDRGFDDRYHHAQGNYFEKPIYDERGICRYKLEAGQPVERTQEEMDADYVEPEPIPEDGLTGRVAALEAQLAAYEAAYAQGVNEA